VESRAKLWEGRYYQQTALTIKDFVLSRRLFGGVFPSSFLVFGVSEYEEGLLLTIKQRDYAYGSIARCREDLPFAEGEPGVVCVNYDPPKDAPPLSWRELYSALCKAFPQAWKIMHWHLSEAKRLLASVAMSEEQRNAVELDRWLCEICRKENITEMPPVRILNGGPNQTRTKKARDLALDILRQAGRVRDFNKDGRDVISVNPALISER
jgi:hypothetical protein